jgi:prepilin-type N-terminal cleavage/methylation domain-containing protein
MMRKSFSRQSIAGFSLIELLTVIVIIGVLFGIAAPGWLAFSNRQRASSARDQVLQALRLAQSDAQRTRRGQSVILNTSVDPPTLLVRPTGVTTGGVPQPLGNGQYRTGMVALQTTGGITTIKFDELGNLPPDLTLPIKLTVSAPPGSRMKRCVIVETLLGAMRTETDTACNP